MSEILLHTRYRVGEFTEPPIEVGSSVNLTKLTEGDPHPVFVTLPIAKVGARSRNGRTYDKAAVQSIVTKINTSRSTGIRGHLTEAERATRFDLPSLVWIGAKIEPNGLAWAKAYVPTYSADTREYLRIMGVVESEVGTSIYGTADIDESGNVTNLQIESIDLGHPQRLGVASAAAIPIVTSELHTPRPAIAEGWRRYVHIPNDIIISETVQQPTPRPAIAEGWRRYVHIPNDIISEESKKS